MKKAIVVGIPDKYLQELISKLEKEVNCESITKKYTSFQFFNDYKIGEIDVIFIDISTPDRDIVAMAKEIRGLDNKPIIVGVSVRKNPILIKQFKEEIVKSYFIIKTDDYKSQLDMIFAKKERKEKKEYLSQKSNKNKEQKVILVVDDFENTLNIVQYSLEQAGFKAITALSAREALRKLDANIVPDVIITDLNMPKMDGFEFIANIRKFDHLKEVPIFILTTEFSVTKKIKAKGLNITGWIQKPYDINEFIETINKAI